MAYWEIFAYTLMRRKMFIRFHFYGIKFLQMEILIKRLYNDCISTKIYWVHGEKKIKKLLRNIQKSIREKADLFSRKFLSTLQCRIYQTNILKREHFTPKQDGISNDSQRGTYRSPPEKRRKRVDLAKLLSSDQSLTTRGLPDRLRVPYTDCFWPLSSLFLLETPGPVVRFIELTRLDGGISMKVVVI